MSLDYDISTNHITWRQIGRFGDILGISTTLFTKSVGEFTRTVASFPSVEGLQMPKDDSTELKFTAIAVVAFENLVHDFLCENCYSS